jgi:DNA-binding transcriptional LysR family regulator
LEFGSAREPSSGSQVSLIYRQDFKTLQLFICACELRSLSRAAERLGLAPSAATRRIQLLEHDAKTPLLERLPHGVQPTASGKTFLRFARDILHLVDRTNQVLVEHESGLRGYIRVSSSSSVLMQSLATELSRFASVHPDIEIDLDELPTEATLEMLKSKRADIGVIVCGAETGPLVTFPFGGDNLVLAVPAAHPLAKRERISFHEIIDEDFVTLRHGAAVRRVLAEQARLLGRVPKIRVQVNSFEVMSLMASNGLGIGILPDAAVRPLRSAFNLSLVEIDEPWARREFAICVRSLPELDSPARRLLSFLTNH